MPQFLKLETCTRETNRYVMNVFYFLPGDQSTWVQNRRPALTARDPSRRSSFEDFGDSGRAQKLGDQLLPPAMDVNLSSHPFPSGQVCSTRYFWLFVCEESG